MKVIIGMLTYNLEKYVAESIESVLQQKTDFDYKILIADDKSSDRTVEILKEYRSKYPDKIELILSNVNSGCAGNAIRIYEKLNSEYFAILDGDDVWVGTDRLQKQVDFLDRNLQYTMCAGQTQYWKNGDILGNIIPDKYINKDYMIKDFFAEPVLFHVSGLLYRNVIFKKGVPRCFYDTLDTFENCASRGEDLRRVMHLEKGPLYAFADIVSKYRIHENGIWSGSSATKKLLEGAVSANFYRKYYLTRFPELSVYIEDFFHDSYRAMWRHLVNEKQFANVYTLTSQEGYLLSKLLESLAIQQERDKCNYIVDSSDILWLSRKENFIKRALNKLKKYM